MKKIIAVLLSLIMVLSFAACSSDKDTAKEPDQDQNEAAAPADSADAEASSDALSTQPPEETKYGNAEVYENEAGNPVAKTESGVEVELTGENLQELMAEYEKVKDSDPERTAELLDQIQIILEASPNMQPAQ